MAPTNNLPRLFWIGENAFEQYKNIDPAFLQKFNHCILLFDDEFSLNKGDDNILYLSNIYPFIERPYSLNALQDPINFFLTKYFSNNQRTVFIGDPYERLFQTIIISAGIELQSQSKKVNTHELFATINKMDNSDLFKHNLMDCDLVHLFDDIPFEELATEKREILNISFTGFGKIYEQTKKSTNINDFLWYLYDNEANLPVNFVKH